MEKKTRGIAAAILILSCILPLFTFSTGYAQDNGEYSVAYQKAVSMLARLSPEEKVGQLFLITFDGRDINQDSQIYELITRYQVGGVVLRKDHDNFTGPEGTVSAAYNLVSGLQKIEWQAKDEMIPSGEGSAINDFIPLFVGIQQGGDSYPSDQIINGLTPIPSQMALGASWDTSLSEKAGTILGKELATLGINLLLGPSLDIAENAFTASGDDLSVRTFGGDTFWVGEMGKAYIKGLHTGSSNRLAIIARNFPGRGSSDRLPEQEVATVRKSLDQLKLIELAPFFQVTDIKTTDPSIIVEGLLLNHIRYQGFQGNIRATTKPVSFDQTAVDLLMNLAEFSSWRKNSGILVSEDLGAEAVRKFFSTSGQTFDARQVARNAFLAGNDLLYLDQFVSSGDKDRFETYKKTIDLFNQKYREDQAFAARVDASVLRILTLKYELYPEFDIKKVVSDDFRLVDVGVQNTLAFDVASASATLISPGVDELSSTLIDAPNYGDKLVIFTDTVSTAQCSTCQIQNIVAVDSLQKAILKLYGPSGSAQIFENQFTSYSFTDLQDFIDNPFNRVELETNLSRADWVIFLVQDTDSSREGAGALENLIKEKIETIRNKKVIVFALNAPYYFDATDISAFTAYYGLYSKLPAFIEVAARILFQEINPIGSSPVSIPGVAYNMITATTPKESQIIALQVDETAGAGGKQATAQTTDEPQEKVYNLGDNLPVRTGVILDHNGHPVPDGTVVRFILSQQGENVTIQQIETTTVGGIARASIKLQSEGMHEIRATSEPAMNSQILVLNISSGQGAQISAINPTPVPTEEGGGEVANVPAVMEPKPAEPIKTNNKLLEWLLTSMLAWGSGIVFFYNSDALGKIRSRAFISTGIVAGGLLTAFWQILGFAGPSMRAGFSGYANILVITLLGEIIFGLVLYIYVQKFMDN